MESKKEKKDRKKQRKEKAPNDHKGEEQIKNTVNYARKKRNYKN